MEPHKRIVENDLLKQDWRSRKKKQIFQYIVLKWAFVLLIGMLTGIVGFFNNLAVENIAGFKLLLTSDLMLKHSGGTSQHFWHMEVVISSWQPLLLQSMLTYHLLLLDLSSLKLEHILMELMLILY
ncbi:hypothetical protein GUJ93_ZPchr0014g47371 [Zizania palustris]|uniref:Chloride channel protein n=1 Tax=Zizania palustris TaxID=103762 RepID=A0A8J5TEP3_ZIZPA|nr:hypothetical protein GUJ93_ZPchr0014g47371 [Zizania palustris]